MQLTWIVGHYSSYFIYLIALQLPQQHTSLYGQYDANMLQQKFNFTQKTLQLNPGVFDC